MTQAEALALTLAVEAAAGALLGGWLGRPRWQVGLTLHAQLQQRHALRWSRSGADRQGPPARALRKLALRYWSRFETDVAGEANAELRRIEIYCG